MPIELALYQPEIPQNTGTLLRLGACLSVPVHVIHPTGFAFSHKLLKRSGLDYLDHVDLHEHISFQTFNRWRLDHGRRLILLTTKTDTSAYSLAFGDNDILMVGRESAGVSDTIASQVDEQIRIPMRAGLRSINVALAASLIVGEAKRQTGGFETLL